MHVNRTQILMESGAAILMTSLFNWEGKLEFSGFNFSQEMKTNPVNSKTLINGSEKTEGWAFGVHPSSDVIQTE